MNEFIKIPANKMSLSKRKPVYGVGINNAKYITQRVINKKVICCPIYLKWHDMLSRAYCLKFKERSQTYRGVTVCDEWLTFSNFSDWFCLNSVDGYELDKDIKVKGNKIYSPETCLFVPHAINSLLGDSGAIRGDFPIGVSLFKQNNKYRARLKIDGHEKHIGYFMDSESASKAYANAKNLEIARKSFQYPEFAEFLMQHLK